MEDKHKFRVWCENKKEWEQDEVLISSKDHYTINGKTREEDPKHHVVERCTGLKDNKGKLIYENDIVKFLPDDKIGRVMYSEGRYIAAYPNEDICDELFYHHQQAYATCEIIGNFHENPELLK